MRDLFQQHIGVKQSLWLNNLKEKGEDLFLQIYFSFRKTEDTVYSNVFHIIGFIRISYSEFIDYQKTPGSCPLTSPPTLDGWICLNTN